MKFSLRVILMTAVFLAAAVYPAAQKPADLAGTWVGSATIDGQSEPNELTLVLEESEGALTGHITGQYGTLNQAVIREVSVEPGMLKFTADAETGGGGIAILFTMKVSGDSMEGELDVPDMGVGGTWEATRQK